MLEQPVPSRPSKTVMFMDYLQVRGSSGIIGEFSRSVNDFVSVRRNNESETLSANCNFLTLET